MTTGKRRPGRGPERFGFVGAAAALLVACGGAQRRERPPPQPLEERRALQVIARAVHDEGSVPTASRPVVVGAGRTLMLDVGVEGHLYGVSYTNAQERDGLGSALPARTSPDQLQLVQGSGPDAGTRILALQDVDYVYDDHLGSQYDSSTITAERKLSRDVHDFLVEALEARWP